MNDHASVPHASSLSSTTMTIANPTAPQTYSVKFSISGTRKKATAKISVLATTSITRSIPSVATAMDVLTPSR